MRRRSLRRRLLVVGGLGLLLVSAAASALLGLLFERAARDSLDARLREDLLTVLAQAEIDAQGALQLRREPADARYQRVFSGSYWQISDLQGRALAQSRSLWDEALAAPVADDPRAQERAREGVHGDAVGPMQQPLRRLSQQVRLPRSTSPLWITVATDRSGLDADVAAFRRDAAIALAVLVALWLAVLASQVHFGLRPLRTLGRRLERVRRGEIDRLPDTGLDREIAPVVDELNVLLDHHQRMINRARSSAADLAHALKTPLSVLAAEADGPGEDWRGTVHAQVQRMQASIDRHLVTGLVVDHRTRSEAAPVLEALCTLMQRLHGARGIRFERRIDPDLAVMGDRADLEEMVGNLLDNAGRWATATVVVRAAREDGGVAIRIRDDGPGLPEDMLEQVLQRGVRLDERASSSGLGLAISQELATSHGGRLTLENASPGLCARLWLPGG